MRLHRWALATLLLLLGPTAVEPAGSDTALRRQARQVDSILERLVRADGPGCAVAVLRDGRRIYQRALGLANLEHEIPITSRTAFNLASTSKQLTAFTVLLLAREGALSLDDEVREHLPELRQVRPPIRIRHLLHHTSGLRDYSMLLQYAGVRMYKDYVEPAEVLRTIVRQEGVVFPAGERFEYSNSNYWLLAEIVERVTGSSFGAVLDEKIFEPLGMRHTLLQDDMGRLIPGRATAYAPVPGGGFRIKEDTFPSLGDGGVFTTLDDFVVWARSHGTSRVGDGTVWQFLVTPGILDGGEKVPYGGGLELGEHRGRPVLSHAGFTGGYRAEILRVPSEELAVLVLSNLSTLRPDALALDIADVFLDALDSEEDGDRAPTVPENPEEIEASIFPQAAMAGTFQRAGGSIFELFVRRGRLVGLINGGGEFLLERSGADTYRIVGSPDETFRFRGGPEGGVTGFEYRRAAGSRASVYERVAPLGAEVARGYVGRYRSPDLGVTYEVRSDRGLLSLHIVEVQGRRVGPLVRREGDVFTGGGRETYEFERHPQGRVQALVLAVPRMGRLRLPKESSVGEPRCSPPNRELP